MNGINYCDAVYNDVTDLHEVLMQARNIVGEISFKKVQESSPLYNCVKNSVKITNTIINVKINFGDSFNEYIKSLSKSTRQNLRTAINRLQRDGCNVQLRSFYGGDPKLPHEMKKCLKLYTKRHKERYGVTTSKIKEWLLIHLHFATSNYLHLTSAITFVLYIDNEVAAFMSGLMGNAKQFVVPRLSINSDFSFYSPGMVMLQEVIRYFIENTDIRCLDLSQGNEQYKYKMGGIEHKTVDFLL